MKSTMFITPLSSRSAASELANSASFTPEKYFPMLFLQKNFTVSSNHHKKTYIYVILSMEI